MNQSTIHYDDLPHMHTDVLLDLPHEELESHIREARSMIDNATMVYDRLRATRMEKIRKECMQRKSARGAES